MSSFTRPEPSEVTTHKNGAIVIEKLKQPWEALSKSEQKCYDDDYLNYQYTQGSVVWSYVPLYGPLLWMATLSDQ